MSERHQRPSEVLGALPHRRPTRRSDKRAAAPVAEPASAPRSERPSAAPTTARQSDAPGAPSPPRGSEIVGTIVQAAAELAEIGLSATARAVKDAVARLPRP